MWLFLDFNFCLMVDFIRSLLQGSIFPPRIHQEYDISKPPWVSYSSLDPFLQYKGIHLAHQYNSGITIMSEISSKTNCTLISVLYQTNRHCQKHRNKPQISLRQKTSVIYQHKKNTHKKIHFFFQLYLTQFSFTLCLQETNLQNYSQSNSLIAHLLQTDFK